MTNMQKRQDDDPLLEEIARERVAAPAPTLSGAAKAAIVLAARQNAQMRSPVMLVIEQLRDGFETLMRPVAYATLAFAGIAGLFSGGLLAGSSAALATLEPEEEMIAYYQEALPFGGALEDVQEDEELSDNEEPAR